MPAAIAQCSMPNAQCSQDLTDILGAAVESLTTTAVEEGDQNPDHMLTILYGLKGEK